MKIVSCQQLNMLPWLGYWHKIKASDVHIAQIGWDFSTAENTNRVGFGETYFTIPIKKPSQKTPIKDVQMANPQGLKKLARTLEQSVMKSHAHKPLFSHLASLLMQHTTSKFLVDFTIPAMLAVKEYLDLKAEIIIDETHSTEDDKTVALMELLLRNVPDMSVYLSGKGGLDYMDKDKLPKSLQVWVQTIATGAPTGSVLDSLARGDVWKEMRTFFGWEFYANGIKYGDV